VYVRVRCIGVIALFVIFRKWTAIYIAFLVFVVFAFTAIMKFGESVPTSHAVAADLNFPVLIIDPGHGGEDGGAIGVDGTIEAQINLEIARKAAEFANMMGYKVVMTRIEDISIHDSDADTLRQKKVSDLKNRVSLCEQIDNGILLSIHQNSFPEATAVQGAQVFYNDIEGSRELAYTIQHALNQYVNIGHTKEAKYIGENSYLMKNVSCPAVLVECGFLSNPTECKMLNSEEHQNRIVFTVIGSLIASLMN